MMKWTPSYKTAIPAKKGGNRFLFIPHRVKSTGTATYKKSLCLSALGHVLLIIGFSLSFFYGFKAVKPLGNPLPIYMLATAPLAAPINASTAANKQQTVLKAIKTSPERKKLSAPNNMRTSRAENTISGSSKASHADNKLILNLLHEAIARQQHYPDTALDLKQTGTVTIGFHLYPDGHLANINILRSSGIDSLDAAAVSAVQAISPIKEAGQHVARETFFSIDVVFI